MRIAIAKHLTSILRVLFVLVPVMLVVNGWVFYRNIQHSQAIDEKVAFRQEAVAATARALFRLKEVEVYQKTYLLSRNLEDWRTWNRSQWRLKQAVAELRMLMKQDHSLQSAESQILTLGDDPDGPTLKAFLWTMLDFQREILFAREKDAHENREALVVSIVLLTAIAVCMLLLTLMLWRQDRENQEQAAQSLRESEERMLMANEAKSRFLANMSHEIRTPLGIILGFIDLAMSSETPENEKPKYLLKIRHNAEVLSRLVDDILDLSKVEAGKLDVEMVDFSLDALLEDIHENFTMRTNKKGIQFFIERDLGIPTMIRTDPVRLRQILTNLVGNAVKFTERGFVRLRVAGKLEAPRRHHLKFTVEDTGLGIEPKNEKRLFTAFSQAEASTARKFGGTGLGLVLSRRMAELIHGKLDLVSTVAGRGSIFELSVPVEHGSPSEEAPLRPARESKLSAVSTGMRSNRLQGISLLLVEDAVDNQLLVKIILEMHGALVTCANDGHSGIEKAKQRRYDVILMDVQMPGMDGFEATQQIKLSGCTTPVVALTAHAMQEEREHALKFGFDDYLTKPINRLDLIAAVEGCAKKRQSGPLADGRGPSKSPEISAP